MPPSSCYHPPAIILMLSSSCSNPPAIILLPPSSCYHPPAIILLLSSSCLHSPATILLLSSSCYHPPAILLLLSSSCFHPPAIILLLSSPCYHPPASILLLSSSCYHPPAIILLLLLSCGQQKTKSGLKYLANWTGILREKHFIFPVKKLEIFLLESISNKKPFFLCQSISESLEEEEKKSRFEEKKACNGVTQHCATDIATYRQTVIPG